MPSLTFDLGTDLSTVAAAYADGVLVGTTAPVAAWTPITMVLATRPAVVELRYSSGSGHSYFRNVLVDGALLEFPAGYPYDYGEAHANAFTGAELTVAFQGTSGTNYQWSNATNAWVAIPGPGVGGATFYVPPQAAPSWALGGVSLP